MFVAVVRGERKKLFFIELYDFFKEKNSIRVATVFSISKEAL